MGKVKVKKINAPACCGKRMVIVGNHYEDWLKCQKCGETVGKKRRDIGEMDLVKLPKWAQKHIELLNGKLELAKELLKSKNNLNLLTLNEKDKVELIDCLLRDLKIDNFGNCQDRPNKCSYRTLYREGEIVGEVLKESYGKNKKAG